jgi:hypothetical protein
MKLEVESEGAAKTIGEVVLEMSR